ncbi:hypothetical protein [Myxococcus hansupus]|nr:hypothetical protein [Myxococcus hansupus]
MNRTSLLSLCAAASLFACTERTPETNTGKSAAPVEAQAPTPAPESAAPPPSKQPTAATGTAGGDSGAQAPGTNDSGVGEYTGAPAGEKATCSASGLSPRAAPASPPLPPAAESMRQRIIAAAVACDYAALNTLADENGKAVRFSYGGDTDAGDYWRKSEKNGNPDLARIVQVLNLPYAKEGNLYFWPAVHVTGAKSDKDWAAISGIYSDAEVRGMKDQGGYLGLRVGITPEGDWQLAVSGD